MNTNDLRNEYKLLRKYGVAALRVVCSAGADNATYDDMVSDMLVTSSMDRTPENWVAQARVLTRDLGAEATNYEELEYENQNSSDDYHMGYDTLEERAMEMM